MRDLIVNLRLPCVCVCQFLQLKLFGVSPQRRAMTT